MAKKLRRYRVIGVTKNGGFKRIHTLSAYNKVEAAKLVANQYVADGKLKVEALKK